MCGIVGIFSRHDRLSPTVVERATRSLYHRGPDGQRHWISADGRVGLGHARLSIIDLATGDQPIASEDERTRIIVNGEFYGYEAIQRELEARGHRLRTRSDSEIALHLYEDFGAQCLHHLRGEFAFVLWDETQPDGCSRPATASASSRCSMPGTSDALYLASEVEGAVRGGRAGALGRGERVSRRSASADTRCGRCSTACSRSRPAII